MAIQMDSQIMKDKWTQSLEVATKELQDCQASKAMASCFDCEFVFNCDIRNRYVKIVYESMNKGEEGDFEF